jgi:hypothetical protein
MATVPSAKLNIGQVMSRAIALFGQRPALFLGLGFFLYALPYLAFEAARGFPGPSDEADVSAVLLLPAVAILAIGGAILSATLYFVATRADGPTSLDWKDAIEGALPLVIPVILVGTLQALAAGIGFIFFIVPGIILLLMFSVATPVLVAERVGIIDSMKRSRALTSGARWRILLLFVVISLLATLLLAPVYVIASIAPDSVVLLSIVSLVLNTLYVLFPLLIVALYLELRELKEGMAPEQVADVFA